jgi:HemY protein
LKKVSSAIKAVCGTGCHGAPKDAVWTADGYVSDTWQPISPVTGKLDAFEWRIPVEQLGGPQATVLEGDGLEALMGEPDVSNATHSPLARSNKSDGHEANGETEAKSDKATDKASNVKPGSVAATILPSDIIDVEEDELDKEAGKNKAEPAPKSQSKLFSEMSDNRTSSGSNKAEKPPLVEGVKPAETSKIVEEKATPVASATGSVDGRMEAKSGQTKPHGNTKDVAKENDELSQTKFKLDQRPDDPGVRPGAKQEKPKRFGIF